MPQTMKESSEVLRLQTLLLSSVVALGRVQASASSLDQRIAEHERLTQEIRLPERVADTGCSSQKAEKKAHKK